MAQQRKLWILGGSVIILGVVLVTLFSGCGYGKVGPEAYKHATTLYSICNRHDVKRLEIYATILRQARERGEITKQEANWLEDIVETARGGDWESAASNVRRMMQDQIEAAP